MFVEHRRVFVVLEKLRYGVLEDVSVNIAQTAGLLTLDINLNTEVCAWSNNLATSSRLLTISLSSPTARVIRLAKLLRRLWSMLSSQGDPGAKNALYSPATLLDSSI